MTNSKKILLGFQHLFAMFGATILVPTIVGLNPLGHLDYCRCGNLGISLDHRQ